MLIEEAMHARRPGKLPAAARFYCFLIAILFIPACGSSVRHSGTGNRGPDGGPRLADLPEGIFDQILDPANVADPIAKTTAAIVKVERPVGDVLGTGFFLGDGSTLVTNAHVLGPQECLATGCTIRIHSGQFKGKSNLTSSTWLTLVPHAYSKSFDMAVFQTYVDRAATKKYTHPAFFPFDAAAIQRAEVTLKTGSGVALVGHPLGYLIKITKGRIASLSGSFISSELLTMAGTSGGPIVNDQGDFLGLHHRGTQKLEYLRNKGYFGISLATDLRAIAHELTPVVRDLGLKVFLKAEDITSDDRLKLYAEALINGRSSGAPALAAAAAPASGSALAEKLWSFCAAGPGTGSVGSEVTDGGGPSPCVLAVKTLGCSSAERATEASTELPEGPEQLCPNPSQLDVWTKRFTERQSGVTAEGTQFWKITAALRIAPRPLSKAMVDAMADSWVNALKNDGISIGINEAVTVMDITHSDTVANQNVTTWFTDFRKTENYYYAYPQFLRGIFILGRDGFQSANTVRGQLQLTRKDPAATLLDTLLADYLDWRLETAAKGPIRGALSDSAYGLP